MEGSMKRLALFFLPSILIAAGFQLLEQHTRGLGGQPQQHATRQVLCDVAPAATLGRDCR